MQSPAVRRLLRDSCELLQDVLERYERHRRLMLAGDVSLCAISAAAALWCVWGAATASKDAWRLLGLVLVLINAWQFHRDVFQALSTWRRISASIDELRMRLAHGRTLLAKD
jgi:hypothetical protein